MFEFTKGNIGIYISQNGVPNINPLERKYCIDQFMNAFRSIPLILLSSVIVMDITIRRTSSLITLGRKPLLSLNMNRPTLYVTMFINGNISSDKKFYEKRIALIILFCNLNTGPTK